MFTAERNKLSVVVTDKNEAFGDLLDDRERKHPRICPDCHAVSVLKTKRVQNKLSCLILADVDFCFLIRHKDGASPANLSQLLKGPNLLLKIYDKK